MQEKMHTKKRGQIYIKKSIIYLADRRAKRHVYIVSLILCMTAGGWFWQQIEPKLLLISSLSFSFATIAQKHKSIYKKN